MPLKWAKFVIASAYGFVVFMFFFAYLAGFVPTANIANDILYVGLLIMVGIVLDMASSIGD